MYRRQRVVSQQVQGAGLEPCGRDEEGEGLAVLGVLRCHFDVMAVNATLAKQSDPASEEGARATILSLIKDSVDLVGALLRHVKAFANRRCARSPHAAVWFVATYQNWTKPGNE